MIGSTKDAKRKMVRPRIFAATSGLFWNSYVAFGLNRGCSNGLMVQPSKRVFATKWYWGGFWLKMRAWGWEPMIHLSIVLDTRRRISTDIIHHTHFHYPSTALQPAVTISKITAFEATDATRGAWNLHTQYPYHAKLARSLGERTESIVVGVQIGQAETQRPM